MTLRPLLPSLAIAALLTAPGNARAGQLAHPSTATEDLGATASIPGNHMPGELIVRFNADPPTLRALSVSAGHELSFLRRLSGGEWHLKAKGDVAGGIPALAKRLEARGDVQYAQPNYILQIQMEPNDEFYPYQWHYGQIDLQEAWEVETGDPSVVVAVLDSGITQHPDLVNKLVMGYDFVSHRGNGADGDGVDADPTDPGRFPIYHGTHVAGTVAAETDNGEGVAGVCWGCRVAPVRVLGSMWGTTTDVIEGIRWAVGMQMDGIPLNPNPANVINLSLGENLGEGLTCAVDDPAMQSAVDEARSAGVVVVAAAGNSHADATSYTPANCDGVITVAATTRYDHRAYYSNFGESIDVAAPGGGLIGFVWSTYDADLYMGFVGTSQASPHVAGVVGLMLSANPDLTGDEILDILKETARPLPQHKCFVGCGAGRINAFEAVLEAQRR